MYAKKRLIHEIHQKMCISALSFISRDPDFNPDIQLIYLVYISALSHWYIVYTYNIMCTMRNV